MGKIHLKNAVVVIAIVCSTCIVQAQSNDDEILREQREQTISNFRRAVEGDPITVPLYMESDPTWFLMPVSNDSVNLCVDRVYLVDGTKNLVDFERDIYHLDSIKVIERTYLACISGIKNHETREVEIDGYMYRLIQKINNNEYEGIPSSIRIPIILSSR